MRWPVMLGAMAALLTSAAHGGDYAPASDQSGAVGIPADSSAIVGWATGVVAFQIGPVDSTRPDGALASSGTPGNTLGVADATVADPTPVLSLGDGGWITLSFARPIVDGPGPDFAVYENGFAQDGESGRYFLELAYVEISSNGQDFFRFPSISLTQAGTQIPGFGTLDPTDIYNLAGKEIAGYGVPFDLSELAGFSPLLDVGNILQVRVRDVIGSLTPGYQNLDSQGHIINDPWKTNFAAGGFDLDAVAVLHQAPEPTAMWLAGAGLAIFGGSRRRRAQR